MPESTAPDAVTRSEESDALARWERRTALPMAIAAVAYLTVYAWPILDPGLSRPWTRLCTLVAAVTWVLFVSEFLVRVRLAPQRWAYVRRNPVDVVTLALPALRPLRVLRTLQVLRVVASLWRLDRHGTDVLRGRLALYTTLATGLVVFVGAVAVLDAERGAPGADIESFGDALWWSVSTVSTVGYGDYAPVTVLGRCVAAGLMVAGLAVLGVVAGGLSSWLVARVDDGSTPAYEADQTRAMDALTAEVRALRAEVARLRE